MAEKFKRLKRPEKLTDLLPYLKIGTMQKDLAVRYGVRHETVNRWIKRLKKAGYPIPEKNKGGRKPLRID